MKTHCVSQDCHRALEMTKERVELHGNYCLPCNTKATRSYGKPKVSKHYINPFVHFENGVLVLKDERRKGKLDENIT